MIVVYEVKGHRLIGITEFVFGTWEQCAAGAEEARRELALHLMPRCFLRWMKAGDPGGS